MTVRVYTSSDASAPTLTGQVGSLIALLSACLVNGYGAKSSSGWSILYSGTNEAVYKAGSGNAFPLQVIDTSTISANATGYESMTNVTTGTNPFPTLGQMGSGTYIIKSNTADSTQRPWILICNGTLFHLWVGTSITVAQGIQASASYQAMFTYGDFVSYKSGDVYNTCIIGHGSTSTTSGQHGNMVGSNSSQNGHFIVRPYTQVAGSSPSGKAGDYARLGYNYVSGTVNLPYPDPITGGFVLTTIDVFDQYSSFMYLRGNLPGFYFICHNLPGTCGDVISGTGTYAGKTFMLLDVIASGSVRARVAIETSNTW